MVGIHNLPIGIFIHDLELNNAVSDKQGWVICENIDVFRAEKKKSEKNPWLTLTWNFPNASQKLNISAISL